MNASETNRPTSANDSVAASWMANWFALIVVAALALVPLLTIGCKDEMAKWVFASGLESFAAQNPTTALTQMERANRLVEGKDPLLKIKFAEFLSQAGKPRDGLKLCEDVIQELQQLDSPDPRLMVRSLLTLSSCLLELGRPGDALDAVKEMQRFISASYAESESRLNDLAYFRSLAGEELDRAAADIARVIDANAVQDLWPCGQPLPLKVKALIAANLIARQLGQSEKAERMLDRAIAAQQRNVDTSEQGIVSTIHEEIRGERFPFNLDFQSQLNKTWRLRAQRNHEILANLLLVRALYRQDRPESENGWIADIIRIKELNFDPQVMVKQLPDNQKCFQTLTAAAAYLDTYGCVLMAQDRFENAIGWLDMAVLAAEYHLAGYNSPLHNHSQEAFGDDRLFLREATRLLVEVIEHRKHARNELGDTVGVAEDQARIRELTGADQP